MRHTNGKPFSAKEERDVRARRAMEITAALLLWRYVVPAKDVSRLTAPELKGEG